MRNNPQSVAAFILLMVSGLAEAAEVFVVVLGVAQDAGYPQLNCYQPHCMPAWTDSSLRRGAASIAVVDQAHRQKYLFDATPDVRDQMYRLHQLAPDPAYSLGGVFITHAHIGHYTGLIHFGREATAAHQIETYAMPRLFEFLSSNGPWSQLVASENIQLKPLHNRQIVRLNHQLSVTPIQVPHRDEYSETVAFSISGPDKSALYLPDIDKWDKWRLDITEQIRRHDYALIDATFFSGAELPNRDMSTIPHPSVEESMARLTELSAAERQRVVFIHFNHTNPLLINNSDAQRQVIEQGFRFAAEGMILDL